MASIWGNIFGGGTDTTTTNTQNNIPGWVQGAGANNYAAMQRIVNKPYSPYTGQRVASATPLEQNAWSAAGGLLNKNGYFGQAADYIKKSMGGPQQISMPSNLSSEFASRVNPYDKNYINPYVSATLNPAIRQIRESGDIARNNLGAEATSAGAFGDTRHGIEEGMNYRDEAQNIGDLTAQTYGAAFDKGQAAQQQDIATLLGLQGADVTNKMQAQGANANLMENFYNRNLAGGAQLGNLSTAQTQDLLDRINAAAGAGQSQRGIQQAKNDFNYQQFLEGRDWDQHSIDILNAALSGTPYARSTIQTQQTPNQGAGGLIGAALGTILK